MTAQVNVEFDEWTDLVEQYREIKKEAAEIAMRKTYVEERLQNLCGDNESVQRDGLKVQRVTSRSPVQWRKVPEIAHLNERYLDSFRGATKTFYKFTFCA